MKATRESVHAAASTTWQYSRAEERRRWRKDPAEFVRLMQARITKGWAFCNVSRESHETEKASIAAHLEAWVRPE